MRRHVSLYGLTFSLPLLIWQLLFFVFPLAFLVALSFWTVKNFAMKPDFDTINWVTMFSRKVFWQAYGTTFALAAAAATLTSVLAFPCSYAIAFKLSDTARRWLVFLMVIPFFTSYLVRVYSWQIFLSDAGIINVLLGSDRPWPLLDAEQHRGHDDRLPDAQLSACRAVAAVQSGVHRPHPDRGRA